METITRKVSENHKNVISTQGRLVCVKTLLSTNYHYICHGRQNQQPYGKCNALELEQKFQYASSLFALLSQLLIKVLNDQVNQVIFVTPVWQTQPQYY